MAGISWNDSGAADGVADGLCKSFPVFGDASAEAAAFRFFNSAGVGAPRFNTGRSGSSAGAETDGEEAEATSVVPVAGRFSTGRSESASASGGAGGVAAAGGAAGAGEL